MAARGGALARLGAALAGRSRDRIQEVSPVLDRSGGASPRHRDNVAAVPALVPAARDGHTRTMASPDNDPFDLDFSNYAPPPVTEAQQESLKEETEVGATKLGASGFFTTVNRVGRLRPQPGEKPVVLVVEDDDSTRMVLEQVVAKLGYVARGAADKAGILQGLKAAPRPSLVLLDVMLPDADGFGVLNKIRQSPSLSGLPVVMLTSRSEKSDILKGLALGADGYITKPAKLSVLQKVMAELLG